MSNFGIHSIPTDTGHCYFIIRPFGNYLIFADHLKQYDEEIFKQFGGLSKMFFESRSSINKIHKDLFDKFGTSAVSDFLIEEFHQDLPLHRWNIEHTDPALNWYHHGQRQLITFKQKDQIVTIICSEIYLDNKKFYLDKKDISESIYEHLEKQNTDLVYASHFSENACLKLKR